VESGETGAARFNVSNFDQLSDVWAYSRVWAAGLRTEVLKFGASRFLLALEVFDHISDGGEAVHSP